MQTYIYIVKNQITVRTTTSIILVFVERKEQSVKARLSEIHLGKLHLDCYQFYQHCKDYFDIATINKNNNTPFAVFFLCEGIRTHWIQQKHQQIQETQLDLIISWKEFKAFFYDNCGNSKTFVKEIWNKFRKNFQQQLKDAQDQVSQLENLQSIPQEFDTKDAHKEFDLVKFFQNGFQLSIQTKIESLEEEQMNSDVLIEKTTVIEEKTGR